MTANRSGASNGIREDAAVRLAAKIAKLRGHVTDEDVQAFRAEGYSDAELLEVILLVALNTLANYVNEVTGTEIDFPAIHKRTRTQAAA
jgi:alkylhydroperoxidase family enzyme